MYRPVSLLNLLQTTKTYFNKKGLYQRVRLDSISLNGKPHGLALFLNGEIQFLESEERPYHRALALIPAKGKRNILILGGGDGLAVRSILEDYPHAQITLCELDPLMIEVFKKHPEGKRINKNSLSRCRVIIGDALRYIRSSVLTPGSFDLIVVDFPDWNYQTKDLYETQVHRNISRLLRRGGKISIYSGGNVNGVGRSLIKSGFKSIKLMRVRPPVLGRLDVIHGVKK